MEFSELANDAIAAASSYAKAHPFVAGIAVVVALFLFYRRPLAALMILGLGLLLAGVLYTILEMSGSGVSTKERMIRKENVPEEVFRASAIRLSAEIFGMPK